MINTNKVIIIDYLSFHWASKVTILNAILILSLILWRQSVLILCNNTRLINEGSQRLQMELYIYLRNLTYPWRCNSRLFYKLKKNSLFLFSLVLWRSELWPAHSPLSWLIPLRQAVTYSKGWKNHCKVSLSSSVWLIWFHSKVSDLLKKLIKCTVTELLSCTFWDHFTCKNMSFVMKVLHLNTFEEHICYRVKTSCQFLVVCKDHIQHGQNVILTLIIGWLLILA